MNTLTPDKKQALANATLAAKVADVYEVHNMLWRRYSNDTQDAVIQAVLSEMGAALLYYVGQQRLQSLEGK